MMSDDELSADEEEILDRIFGAAKPLRLQGNWEEQLRSSIAGANPKPEGAPQPQPEPLRLDQTPAAVGVPLLARAAAVLVVLAGVGVGLIATLGGDGDGVGVIEGGRDDSPISISEAAMTIRAFADTVTVDGAELSAGSFRDAAPGDRVEVDGVGRAVVTADSVFEIDALRSASLAVPDLSSQPIVVDLDVGHVTVTLDPRARAEVVVDVGSRQFWSRTPDASFAVCQAPDGASCLAVLTGEVEWIEEGITSELYTAGQGSFAATGNAPEPPLCADAAQISEVRSVLQSDEFAGALADIVAGWDLCPDRGEFASPVAFAGLPSAASMERVMLSEPVIGSPDVGEDTESVVAQWTLDGAVDYYIDTRAVTNVAFRAWLTSTAADDAGLWRQHAPAEWLDRAPGGAATQAIFAEGTGDEAVIGVSYGTAVDFCASHAKRLPAEIEWELAAVTGVIEDLADERQDWVADWESYGVGPDDSAGRQVLRGTDPVLAADPYFRVFALDAPEAAAARQMARIRCAASEVVVGGMTFPATVVDDSFTSLGWPIYDEGPLELDYHPENYHLDVTGEHAQVAVVRPLAEPASTLRIDVDLFIERTTTGSDTGSMRFGTIFGAQDDLSTLSVQPDNFAGDRFLACLLPLDPELAANLSLDSPGTVRPDGSVAVHDPGESHYGEDCEGATSSVVVPVASIDFPLRLSTVLANGQVELWANDVLVSVSEMDSEIEVYGFFSHIYHRPRSHIHIDDLLITGP